MSASVCAAGHQFATYYDCTPGRDTALVITNTSDYDIENAYILSVYDSGGALLLQELGGLAAFESTALFLGDLLEARDPGTWGLAVVESPLLLVLGSWIGQDGEWIATVNSSLRIGPAVAEPSPHVWYSINFANTNQRSAGISIINPSDEPLDGVLYVYDASGERLGADDFSLEPRGSSYFLPESVLPRGDDVWGFVDVRVPEPILLVGEYYDAEDRLFDVDVVDAPYFQERDTE